MRTTMDASGNVVRMQEETNTSDSENVTVSSDSNPSSISLKGESINFGDVSVRKEDLILVMLVLNMVMLIYD